MLPRGFRGQVLAIIIAILVSGALTQIAGIVLRFGMRYLRSEY